MKKLSVVKVGLFDLRLWTHEKSEWVVGLTKSEFALHDLHYNVNRFDVRYLLEITDWEFSRLVVDKYNGKIYPWFGRSGMEPLAAFPDYWAAKKFTVEYLEPILLMQKMSDSYGSSRNE